MKRRMYIAVLALLLASTHLFAQAPTRYTLSEGDTFTATSVVDQNIEQSLFGQTMTTTQNIISVDIYEVVAVTAQGYRLKTTGISRKLDTTSPQGTISMDSEKEGDDNLAFRALSGKTYFIDMDHTGKVISMDGVTELKDAVRAELAGTALESVAESLLDAYSETTLFNSFEGLFHIYPEAGNTSLNRQEEMVINNLPIFMDISFKPEGANSIVADGTLTMLGDINVGGVPMTADMKGTQTSTFSINAANGMSTKIETIQDMEGELQVQGTSVPMTLKTKVTVTIE